MTGFVKIILEASFTAGLAALAVMLIRLAMKKAPKRWAYALWAVVFFRCLCPFSVESGLSVFNAIPEHITQERTEELSETVESFETEHIPPVQTELDTYGHLIAMSSNPVYAPTDKVEAVPVPEKKPVNKYEVMFGVWAFGASAMALYGMISYVLLMRKLRTAVKTEEGVYESDLISTAFSAGFFPPKIYVPCGLFEEERKLIIAHERVHIKRLDYIVKPIAFLALTLHWFNPVIWLAFALMTRDMELSCDEAVLKIFGSEEKKAYSEALLRVSMKRSGLADSYNFLPLAFAETGIKGRVKNVLKYKKPTLIVTVLAAAAVIAACVVLGTNAKKDNSELLENGNIEYVEFRKGVTNRITDVNGNNICLYDERGEFGKASENSGVYYKRAFVEGDIDLNSSTVSFGDGSLNRLIMAVDMTEFKINSLEVFSEEGKNFLKAQFEFTLAEGAKLPTRDGLIRLGNDKEPRLLMVEGGGNDGVYVISAEYELQSSDDGQFAFMLNDFADVPVYINSELVKDEEKVYTPIPEGETDYAIADGAKETSGYTLVSDGSVRLTLETGETAYVACGFKNISFETDNGTYSVKGIKNKGASICCLSTNADGSSSADFSDVLDFGEHPITSVTVENMYIEKSGTGVKLYTEIKAASPTGDGLMDNMAINDGDFEIAVAKLINDEYRFTIVKEYDTADIVIDGFAVIIGGLEDVPVYVNKKLLTDNFVNRESRGSIQKVYKNGFVFIELYDSGYFTVTNFISSLFIPSIEKAYRYEGDSLILEYNDGSELYFDVDYDENVQDNKLIYNGSLSHVTDELSRYLGGFGDGEVFLPDEEWLEIEKAAEREKAYRNAVDCTNVEMAYSRDFRTIYLFKNGNFDLYDSSWENDPNEGIDGSYEINGETLTLKYTDGSKLCFNLISSAKEETDPALVKEFELCKYKLVYDSKNSRISKKDTGDIPEIYHGEIFDYDVSFIGMKMQLGDVSEEFMSSRQVMTDEEYYHEYTEKQILAEEERRNIEEEERKRVEEKDAHIRKFEDCNAAVKFIENPYTEFSKAYFNGVNVLLLQDDGTFMIDCIVRNYAPSEPPEKDYAYDEDGALLLNFNDGSLLRFVPNDDNLSFDLNGSHSNTPMDVLLYDDGAVFINYENAEEYMQFLKDTGSMIYLQYPVDGEISKGYSVGDNFHHGVDFAVPKGTEVYAAASGEVTEIGTGWNGGYGTAVTIKCVKYDMFDMENIYAHMNEVLVKEGDKVNAGDLIGYSGSTGDAVGNELHFEVKIDGSPVDPEEYLQ